MRYLISTGTGQPQLFLSTRNKFQVQLERLHLGQLLIADQEVDAFFSNDTVNRPPLKCNKILTENIDVILRNQLP
jgi:hypothetical protein